MRPALALAMLLAGCAGPAAPPGPDGGQPRSLTAAYLRVLCDFPDGPPKPPASLDKFCDVVENDGKACCLTYNQKEIGICVGGECAAAPSYCQADVAPYEQRVGIGFEFGSWSDEKCLGAYAAGPWTSVEKRPCVQWSHPGEVEGNVFCVDPAQPLSMIYYLDPNANNVCSTWTLTTEDWHVWPFCGRHPLPQ